MADDPWDDCATAVERHDYLARAREVYWYRHPACGAHGGRYGAGVATCLLNPGHSGKHYGNGFDDFGPKNPVTWAAAVSGPKNEED